MLHILLGLLCETARYVVVTKYYRGSDLVKYLGDVKNLGVYTQKKI